MNECFERHQAFPGGSLDVGYPPCSRRLANGRYPPFAPVRGCFNECVLRAETTPRVRPAYLPTCDVRRRDLQRQQYVDSSRLRPNNAPMPMPARRWMQAQATRHPAV